MEIPSVLEFPSASMDTKFVKISTPSGKQPEQPLKMHPICANVHQIFYNKCQKMQLDLCIV
jgi:hypothetical protein